jgi:hypothetical protein
LIGLLIFGTIADLLLACVLVAVSGFIFGGGPQGMSGDPGGTAMWMLALVGSLGAPVAGFALWRYGRAGIGAAITWLPPVVGVILSFP